MGIYGINPTLIYLGGDRRMRRPIRVGITGAGMTVPWFLEAAEQIPEMEVGALFARKEEKRRELCEKYQIPASYDSYEKLLADDSLDVLYLPLPNSLHYSFAKQALEAGKHLIMEKPFTVTYAEAAELAELAEKKGLILFEAVTNQYNPNYEKVRELLPGLGDIKIVQIDFAQYSSRYDAFKQGNITPVFDVNKAGGALFDLNVYNIHFVTGLFGEPAGVHYFPNIEQGVDTSGILILEYPSFKCACIAAKDCAAPLSVNIQGDKGCIFSHSNTSRFPEFSYQENGKEAVHYELVKNVPVFYDELRAFADYWIKDDREAFRQRLDQSLLVMKVLDRARGIE